jgi:hypothetical protein
MKLRLSLLILLALYAESTATATLSFGAATNISMAFESTPHVAGSWTEDFNNSGNQQIDCIVGFATTSHICGSPGTGTAQNIGIPAAPGGTTPPGANYFMADGDPTYGAPISTVLTGLTVGHTYQISFYQASSEENGNNKAYNDNWQVYVIPGASAGAYICPVCTPAVTDPSATLVYQSTVMVNTGAVSTNWELETFNFTPTNKQEVLEFVTNAVGTGTFMPPFLALADVEISPEPGTFGLTIIGAVVVFGVSRLRRRFAGNRAPSP